MSLIEWDDNLSVHVAEIDLQHKELIKILNHLDVAIREKKGNDALARILEGLTGYAEHHFKLEEDYFAQFGYPDEKNHKEEHLTFVLKILGYQEKLKKEELCISTDVLNFLWDWLKHHIMVTDSKYSQFFNENGLK